MLREALATGLVHGSAPLRDPSGSSPSELLFVLCALCVKLVFVFFHCERSGMLAQRVDLFDLTLAVELLRDAPNASK